MAHYNKGASAERELMKIFWERGFAVARVAGSGKNPLPMPDLIVMGKGRSMVLECKAWKGKYLAISKEQMGELFKWQEIGNAEVFIAWKYPNKGWVFLKSADFNQNKYYTISYPDAQKKGALLDILLNEQSRLKV